MRRWEVTVYYAREIRTVYVDARSSAAAVARTMNWKRFRDAPEIVRVVTVTELPR